jgi:hypothetical protein
MPQSVSQGIAVIFDSTISGYSPITSGASPQISAAMAIAHLSSFSVQILTDGLAIVDWALQGTLVPAVPIARNTKPLGVYAWRDNSAASNMWSTITSGVMPLGGVYQGTIISQAVSNFRNARLVFTWDVGNTGGATAQVWAAVHGTGL